MRRMGHVLHLFIIGSLLVTGRLLEFFLNIEYADDIWIALFLSRSDSILPVINTGDNEFRNPCPRDFLNRR